MYALITKQTRGVISPHGVVAILSFLSVVMKARIDRRDLSKGSRRHGGDAKGVLLLVKKVGLMGILSAMLASEVDLLRDPIVRIVYG